MQEYNNLSFYKAILLSNIIVLGIAVFIVISILAFRKLTSEITSGYGLPEKFTEIKNIDFNHLTFIATYILPLLSFTLNDNRDIFFMIILLIFIGAIYIKTNLYYLSPVFILFNIKIYSATDESGEEKIIMTREKKMNKNEILHYTEIGDIYFAKRSK